MAGLVSGSKGTCRILDPSAGTGVLLAAVIERLLSTRAPIERVEIVAYEIDEQLIPHLRKTTDLCREACAARGVQSVVACHSGDFIQAASQSVSGQLELGATAIEPFDVVILNPPYRKISSQSVHRSLLGTAGLEVSNLYAGFLGLSLCLVTEGGQLVAITPRSFCNGTYFRSFRRHLLGLAAFSHIHVFDSRREAFQEDQVLQENVVFRLVKKTAKSVVISTGNGSRETFASRRVVPVETVVWPGDPEAYIRIACTEEDEVVSGAVRDLPDNLESLGLGVSTGRLVDFRVRGQLEEQAREGTAPLLYPEHVSMGVVRWPGAGRKPTAVTISEITKPLLVPNGNYVLVKRFSAKEERRRVVAAVYEASALPAPTGVAFENHLNYLHREGCGLELDLARGLATYLNSTLVDQFFRQFSGHTQVNATDLRTLRFPAYAALREMGILMEERLWDQREVDRVADSVLGVSIDWTRLHVAA
jgi:adenine-specific DNA-methyltransferase